MLTLNSKPHTSRFARHIDKVFWLVIMLLPVIVYLISYSCMEESYTELFSGFNACVPSFPFIQNILDSVCEKAFGSAFEINAYLSYCVGVEILHILYDIIVFIPRLAHKWVGNMTED